MIGIDIVFIPDFKAQFEIPGTRFLDNFTSFELNDASHSACKYSSLAGKWASKEAFIKAFSQLTFGSPPLIEQDKLRFNEIEVRKDLFGRPTLRLYGEVLQAVIELESQNRIQFSISISHDGDYATAICLAQN